MLRLFTGRAGTGKTAAVINEIHTAVLEKQGRRLLIVPEQYSHEAERELCRVCGDSMSLYAEVMSFTGLARRIASQQGGGAAPYLDKGGRLLCMALALDGAASRLRVYGSAGRRAETQSALLAAVDSLKQIIDVDDTYDNGGALYLYARALHRSGDTDTAAQMYQKVIDNYGGTKNATDSQRYLEEIQAQ